MSAKKPRQPERTPASTPHTRRPLSRWLVGAAALASSLSSPSSGPGAARSCSSRTPIRTSCSSPSTRCAPTRSASYGGRAQTPNLDRLAAGGARFTFAHAHAVVTLPSHTSILTGRLPYEHGMRDNSGFRVKDGTATLATRLKARGLCHGRVRRRVPAHEALRADAGIRRLRRSDPRARGRRSASRCPSAGPTWSSRVRSTGSARQHGRFFAWVHVFDPHSPYKPPADLAATYAAQPYDGEVAFVDRALGPLFDRLATLSRPNARHRHRRTTARASASTAR